MTNRDKLYRLCTYDLLLKINSGLYDSGGGICVLDALEGHFMLSPYCGKGQCDKCILEYLDEEAKV